MVARVQDEHEDAPHALLNVLSAHAHVPLAARLPRAQAKIEQRRGPGRGAHAGPCVGARRRHVEAARICVRDRAELP